MTPTSAIQLAELGGRLWDAIVVGAGPAGSTAALQLARLGKSVLLVDKAPVGRWKVCGGCLSGAATATLERLGLGDLSASASAVPLATLVLSCGRRQSRIRLRGYRAIARDVFDAALVQAAERAGATSLSSVVASVQNVEPDRRWVLLATPECRVRAAARIVVLATGLGGRPNGSEFERRQPRVDALIGAGAVWPSSALCVEPGTIQMALAAGGYVGMVQLADGRINMAAALSRKLLADVGCPGEAARRIVQQAGQNFPGERSEVAWLGTPVLSHRLHPVAAPRLFAIGDLASYEEPFTGEGMAWAMQSACAVLPWACRAIENYDPSLPASWIAAHHHLLARRLMFCGLLGRGLRSPQLTRAATAVLSLAPWLARPLVNSINRPCRFVPDSR